MIDLNEVSASHAPHVWYDVEMLISGLRRSAPVWVPRLFPHGRRQGDEWRLANIGGAPPRKQGSCVIQLRGTHAGDWHDHDGGTGGDPLSTLEHGSGVSGYDLLVLAAKEVGQQGRASPRKVKRARQPAEDAERDIAQILTRATPIIGTSAELYLRTRGLSADGITDLLFHDDLTHWQAKRGLPGMVAVVRNRAGERIALHRTYLDDHKPTKAAVSPARKTLGAVGGGAVRLAEPRNGLIGLAEGIETALAVMTACPTLPTWSVLSARGMERVVLPPEVTRVVLLADNDDAGRGAAETVATKLITEGRRVFIARPTRPGDDFNDLLLREGAAAVADAVAAATEIAGDRSAIKTRDPDFLRNDDGKILPILANAIQALRHHPEWDQVLWHDEFATRTVARKALPWIADQGNWSDLGWSDRDDYLVTEWLQRQEIFVPASIAGQAVETVARDRLFHPVREYLDALSWDGAPRIESWLSRYLAATDNPYTRAVGPRWLISAVARIYKPGCKADSVLILEGPQGSRKSSALKVLAEPWFADRLSDLSSKDAAMETRGVWIIEVAELDTMSRADVSTIKAFISRAQDRFRPPYGKRLVDLARQCVFAGSVNPEGGYLKDATGGRRFWPVACGTIDLDALSRDRDQLWAEALARFRQHEPWWLETRELDQLAAEQQADRYQGDAWEEIIAEWLDHDVRWADNGLHERVRCAAPRSQPLSDVSVREVLEQAVGIERGRWTQIDQNRVVRCLTTMGFRLYWSRKGARREKRYRRSG